MRRAFWTSVKMSGSARASHSIAAPGLLLLLRRLDVTPFSVPHVACHSSEQLVQATWRYVRVAERWRELAPATFRRPRAL